MKTALIEGKLVAGFDRELLQQLAHTPPVVTPYPVKLGVENEYGQIYRIIETGDVEANLQLVERLRNAGYFIVLLDPHDEYSLKAIVKLQEE